MASGWFRHLILVSSNGGLGRLALAEEGERRAEYAGGCKHAARGVERAGLRVEWGGKVEWDKKNS